MFENYIAQIEKYKKYTIYCYGAGKTACAIEQLCRDQGIAIDGFCVTDLSLNQSECNGIPVYEFQSLKFQPKNTLFLIGVLGEKQEVKQLIQLAGGEYILDPPQNIYDYDKWQKYRRERPTLEVTPIIGCKVNCHYCPQKLLVSRYFEENARRSKTLSLQEYRIILNKLPHNTLIEFAGFVEPFLNDEAIDMMEYTVSRNFEITLFTTLVGINADKLERILKIPFYSVCLHVPDEKEYANIPVTAEYLKLLARVVDAKNKDGKPFITTANCQSTPHHAILPVTSGKLRIYSALNDRAGNLDNATEDLIHAEKKGKIYCRKSNNLNHFVLLPDGTVALCCNDFGLQHIVGNLLKQEWQELLRSEEMRKIKRGMMIDETMPILCRKCAYAEEIS